MKWTEEGKKKEKRKNRRKSPYGEVLFLGKNFPDIGEKKSKIPGSKIGKKDKTDYMQLNIDFTREEIIKHTLKNDFYMIVKIFCEEWREAYDSSLEVYDRIMNGIWETFQCSMEVFEEEEEDVDICELTERLEKEGMDHELRVLSCYGPSECKRQARSCLLRMQKEREKREEENKRRYIEFLRQSKASEGNDPLTGGDGFFFRL